mgnify:CR=1 FL=1
MSNGTCMNEFNKYTLVTTFVMLVSYFHFYCLFFKITYFIRNLPEIPGNTENTQTEKFHFNIKIINPLNIRI